jgi:hypothetical protein
VRPRTGCDVGGRAVIMLSVWALSPSAVPVAAMVRVGTFEDVCCLGWWTQQWCFVHPKQVNLM